MQETATEKQQLGNILLNTGAISASDVDDILRIQKEKYPFTFIRDEKNTLANHLNIQQTPTVVYFEKTLIKKISSGISLIGVFQAESFLSP